jgi:hypothetical protein
MNLQNLRFTSFLLLTFGLWSAHGHCGLAQTPAPPAPQPTLKVFQLANAQAQELALVLRGILADSRLAVDERTNSIIISGEDERLNMASALIERLDSVANPPALPATQLDRQAVQVRVVWLVSGLQGERAAPAKDLEPVVGALAQLGIEDLRVVANSLVNVSGKDFTLLGTPVLDAPTRFEVTGTLDWAPPMQHPKLALDLDVREDRDGSPHAKDAQAAPRSLVSLASTIDAPFGQFVVLGAAPIGRLTSVFVVQVVQR